jgi:hypothetical protein
MTTPSALCGARASSLCGQTDVNTVVLVDVIGRLIDPARMIRARYAAVPFIAFALGGCPATVGSVCTPEDQARAERLVYQADGTPAYEGQAMMLTSCGGQSFCHTQNDGADINHFGAPAGLDFDPFLVNDCGEVEPQQERLFRARNALYRHRNDIYASIVTGTMPPRGMTRGASAFRSYTSATDTVGTAMPAINSPEGREIVRNWLACGVPVVEATTNIGANCTTDSDCSAGTCDPGGQCVVGNIESARSGTAGGATWSSVYSGIIQPNCATSGCHTGATPASNLDLSSAASAYTTLTTRSSCSMPFVAAGNPDGSFLIDKISHPTPRCGGVMPPSMLCSDDIASIRAWVQGGALNN